MVSESEYRIRRGSGYSILVIIEGWGLTGERADVRGGGSVGASTHAPQVPLSTWGSPACGIAYGRPQGAYTRFLVGP